MVYQPATVRIHLPDLHNPNNTMFKLPRTSQDGVGTSGSGGRMADRCRSVLGAPARMANVSETLHFPKWLDDLVSQDRVAYPIHATLGSALNWLGGPPLAAAVEWLKAAAHARSRAGLARAARGIAAARRRCADPDRLATTLSASVVHGHSPRKPVAAMRRKQLTAMARAGLRYQAPRAD
jgi:hypothetical protein